jgi:hypothetical protein
MHCIWMKQVVCHSHLHIWHLKGLSQGMTHLMMFSVAALHERRLTICMWLCTGRKWFTYCRLFSVSKMSSLYKSQSRLHEQVWWRNEFCKGSPGEWYTGKFVQSKTIVLHRYNLMCVLYTDELLSIQWWWKIVWLHLEGGCLLYGLRRYSGVLEGYVWGAGCPNHHPEM